MNYKANENYKIILGYLQVSFCDFGHGTCCVGVHLLGGLSIFILP